MTNNNQILYEEAKAALISQFEKKLDDYDKKFDRNTISYCGIWEDPTLLKIARGGWYGWLEINNGKKDIGAAYDMCLDRFENIPIITRANYVESVKQIRPVLEDWAKRLTKDIKQFYGFKDKVSL